MQKTLAWHEQTKLPLLSWSSQARGSSSTGRFTPEVRDNEDLVRVSDSDDNWERLHRAEQLANSKKTTPIQIALAYVLNQTFPTCALIGAQNQAELLSCDEGSRITLTPAEIAWLGIWAVMYRLASKEN